MRAVRVVSDEDKAALRAMMPEFLRVRLGITDLRRPFRCPASDHEDKNPSAHYFVDGAVHCFGCGRTWDVFSLVRETDGVVGFADQAQAVADVVGYQLSYGTASHPARPSAPRVERPAFGVPRELAAVDVTEACRDAHWALYTQAGAVARRYLRSRGLDDGDAERFDLGFVRDPKAIMDEFRVFEPAAAGFVSIPFLDETGTRASYCMLRTIGRGPVRVKEWRPRGLATPLWNEWMLAASLDVLYVCEGMIDAMALSKRVEEPVMALGGISNAKRLAQVLNATPEARRPRAVVLALDEDEPGRKTRDGLAGDLERLGVDCALMLPYPRGAKDADDWLMDGEGTEWVWERVGTGVRARYHTRWL